MTRRSVRRRRAQRTTTMIAAGRGLSPAAASRAVATWAPTPLIARSVGATCGGEVVELGVELDELVVQVLPAASQRAQGEPGCLERRVGTVAAPEPGGLGDDRRRRLADEVSAELLGCGVDDGVDLVAGLRAGLHRRAASDPQQADRFDLAGLGLRGAERVAGEHGAGGADGVGLVGLAVTAAVLTVRAHHLTHIDTLRGEVAGHAGTPRPGALDPDRDDVAV